MPPIMAALVVVMSGSPDHGETTLKPMPAPSASSSKVKAAATKPPAMTAGHETAETTGVSASTMTVSTMAAPCVWPDNEQLWARFPDTPRSISPPDAGKKLRQPGGHP